MKRYLHDYFRVLGDSRQRIPWIVLLLLFSTLLDVVGLGLIAPLIAAVTGSGQGTYGAGLPGWLVGYGGGSLTMLAALIVLVFAVKAVMASWLQFIITRFSENHRRTLMSRLLAAYLDQPYEFHLARSSASLMTTLVNYTALYSGGTLQASIRLVADALIFIVIGAFLAWTDWPAVLLLMTLIGVVFVVYNFLVRKLIRRSGHETAVAGEHIMRMVADSVGPVREVRLFGVESYFIAGLDRYATTFARWSAYGSALQTIPRYLVEVTMVVFLVVISLFAASRNMAASEIIQVLSIFGVAALRLMPASTSLINGINNLRHSRFVLSKLAEDLDVIALAGRHHDGGKAVVSAGKDFDAISFDHVSYAYPGVEEPVIQGLNFTIRRGQAIGIIGRTGSGKSTVADLLLGFLKPQSGAVRVDGHDIHKNLPTWQQQLAYIPQSVFLTDGTLLQNVAFGVPDGSIDTSRLDTALEASQLKEVVATLPQGINTLVGERGVRLSGGQRQRVALARALYHDRQVIVMDEATSALDANTEREVVRAIERLHGEKTLIIIAHRLSTLEGCDAIIEIENGRLVS